MHVQNQPYRLTSFTVIADLLSGGVMRGTLLPVLYRQRATEKNLSCDTIKSIIALNKAGPQTKE